MNMLENIRLLFCSDNLLQGKEIKKYIHLEKENIVDRVLWFAGAKY